MPGIDLSNTDPIGELGLTAKAFKGLPNAQAKVLLDAYMKLLLRIWHPDKASEEIRPDYTKSFQRISEIRDTIDKLSESQVADLIAQSKSGGEKDRGIAALIDELEARVAEERRTRAALGAVFTKLIKERGQEAPEGALSIGLALPCKLKIFDFGSLYRSGSLADFARYASELVNTASKRTQGAVQGARRSFLDLLNQYMCELKIEADGTAIKTYKNGDVVRNKIDLAFCVNAETLSRMRSPIDEILKVPLAEKVDAPQIGVGERAGTRASRFWGSVLPQAAMEPLFHAAQPYITAAPSDELDLHGDTEGCYLISTDGNRLYLEGRVLQIISKPKKEARDE